MVPKMHSKSPPSLCLGDLCLSHQTLPSPAPDRLANHPTCPAAIPVPTGTTHEEQTQDLGLCTLLESAETTAVQTALSIPRPGPAPRRPTKASRKQNVGSKGATQSPPSSCLHSLPQEGRNEHSTERFHKCYVK